MSLTKDVFFRSHVVEVESSPKPISTYNEPKWPEWALMFDTETTLDPKEQALTFGWYRVGRLQRERYICVEEGIVHADGLDAAQANVIRQYVRSRKSEVVGDQYDERIHVYDRSEFVEKVFFEMVRNRGLIVAFNAPWDISRLAVGHKVSRNRGWTLIPSQRTSRKTGELEPNPDRPFIRATSKDSKACFFSLTNPITPEEWPHYEIMKERGPRFCRCGEPAKYRAKDDGEFLCSEHAKSERKAGKKVVPLNRLRLIFRVLDLRTLGWALFNESYSLRSACEALKIPFQKMDHTPTGTVTTDELVYGRQDLRCTVGLLNALKEEFDKHPLDLHPDKAVSPASIGKAYLRAMGIIPPMQKFRVPDYINGIAAQAYFGGRAEISIRQTPVPCMVTDFSSQYPTVNSLLGNPEVLTAESLSFDECTEEIRCFVEKITRDDCFKPRTWKRMKFFALIKPDNDVFPVRSEYNGDGVTKNIGVEHYTSDEPCWMSGPDVIGSKILTGKAPTILKAIRMVPHGLQTGLKPTNLRGMVSVDPRTDDLFKVMVEQKQLFKESDPALSYFLKIAANSTSYGMFFEVTPQAVFQPIQVKVFSGEHNHEQTIRTIERQGEWFCAPIAALITGGAHLCLALIESCLTEKGGHWLYMDTDSACIVASHTGGTVHCPGEPDGIKMLSRKDVEEIAKRFEALNVYDRKHVPGSILKIEKVNFHNGKQIDLFGLAISAKRYVLWRYDSRGNIVIVDAKAHGLGYLYPPTDGKMNDPESDWIFEAWRNVLETCGLAIPRERPKWFDIPAMMRMTVSTPAVLGMLRKFTKPFNFVHVPLPFRSEYADKTAPLIVPFSSDREQWINAKATDTRTGKSYSLHSGIDPTGRTRKLEVKCYGNILGAYREHPEAKFVDREGSPCRNITQGLLRRSHIIANNHLTSARKHPADGNRVTI